ncbi:MAG TPA: DUF6259 domain-containing protein [Candidatus Sulfotelmatobacter sp.]|nr:DUF6259 domain-containing protein [Candidatus Sulfotelmatobacter sp.]
MKNDKVRAMRFFIRFIALATALFCVAVAATAQIRTIDTTAATLHLSEGTGDLVGLRWKDPNLEVIGEPRLGENFRLLVPDIGHEANYFNSRDQHVSRFESIPDGVICVYDSLQNDRERIPVKVRYQIRAVNQQMLFSIEVENRTARKLAEVMYGIIGGQQGIDNRLDTESVVPGENSNLAPHLFRRFPSGGYGGGNLGIRYDANGFLYPGNMTMGWMSVFSPQAKIGYYYANQDSELRLSALYFELRPFSKSASVRDNWPLRTELPAEEALGLTMGWVNFPYAGTGTFQAGPVAFEVHSGDWHRASSIYRGWYDQHFKIARPRGWLRQENAWQSIILSNSEDAIIHRFSELPRLAADAQKYGITTFEILGWDIGGIDRGYPQYQINPQLGTAEEFRKALADLRSLGVHPLIFANVQVADTATPLFHETLKKYTVNGRWAPDWQLWGWGEGTIGARLGLARSNMAVVSPAHQGFRKLLMDQYLQLVRDGADGLQLDKTGILWPLDFNPQLPVSPDKSLPQGVLETFAELLSQARKINPNFALASENTFDRALPYVDVSYTRMGDIDMDTALRYTFPEWTSTIFGESPGDFNPMNNGMRYGMVWALAPRHYNDSVDEILTRPLARYVSELIRIRKQYEDLLFYGRFNDTLGATVQGDADIRYSVFRSLKTNDPSLACVVVNFGDAPESAEVNFQSVTGDVVVATAFNPERGAHLPLRLSIPPHQLAVIVKRDRIAGALDQGEKAVRVGTATHKTPLRSVPAR